MHPILRDRRWLILHIAVWLVAGQMIGLLVHVLVDASWLVSALFGVPLGLVGGFGASSAWYLARSTPSSWTDRVRPIATFILGALVFGAIWAFLGQLWWQLLGRFGLSDLAETQRPVLAATLQGIGTLGYL